MPIAGVDFRKITADDLSERPKCFERDGEVALLRHLNWCVLNPEDDTVPHYYMRNMEPDNYRWGGIIRLADSPLGFQSSAHHTELAQADTVVTRYHKCVDNPDTYEISSEIPFTRFRTSANGFTWKEANVLDVTGTPFPYMVVIHPNSPQGICYWVQPAVIRGTYAGKEICTLGAFDRFFTPLDKTEQQRAVQEVLKHYIWSYYMSVRQDGRREMAYMNICKHNGEGVGIYWLEGEEPIMSDKVTLDAEWHRLPYAPLSDPSLTFTNATWRFGGKEIHFTGKWGAKGHTPTPRLYTVGLTHCYGTWYEGATPREYLMQHCANECSGGTVDNLLLMGFDVGHLR